MVASAQATCKLGACAIGACAEGFVDANGVGADGCEEAVEIPTSGLALWLRADVGVSAEVVPSDLPDEPDPKVLVWLDRSGREFHANGLGLQAPGGYLRTDAGRLPWIGLNDKDRSQRSYLVFDDRALDFSAGITIVAVARGEAAGNAQEQLLLQTGYDDQRGDSGSLYFGRWSDEANLADAAPDASRGEILFGSGQGVVSRGIGFPSDSTQLVVVSLGADAGGLPRFWQNGAELGTQPARDYSGPVGLLGPHLASSSLLGVNGGQGLGAGSGNGYFRGRIGEILIYERALADNERIRLEAYLRARWELAPAE